MIDAEKVIQKSAQEILKHHKVKIQLSVSVPDAVVLVSHIQLALRHPEANTKSSTMARQYADSMIALVGTVSPDLADFMRLGFNEKYDVPRPQEVAGDGKPITDADRFLMFFNLLDPTSPKPTASMDSLIKYFSRIAGWEYARTQMAFDECALRGWINKHD